MFVIILVDLINPSLTMNKKINNILENRISFLEKNKHHLIIDGDTHPTDLASLHPELKAKLNASPNYYQGKLISGEELLAEMNMSGVDMSLSWQNPAATFYTDDRTYNYNALLASNKYVFEFANQFPERILPAGWTDPKALGLEKAVELTEKLVLEFGFPIVKMNPAQNQFPIDSEMTYAVVDKIVSLNAIPAFHFGGDTEFTPAEGLAAVAKRYPESPVIGVHMGGGGSHYVHGEETYQKARLIGLENPNIFYVLSAKRDCHIESDLIKYQLTGAPFNRNINIGSDAPYGRVSWNMGGYQLMFKSLRDKRHPDQRIRDNPGLFDDESIRRYMGRNLAALYLNGCKKLLSGKERFNLTD